MTHLQIQPCLRGCKFNSPMCTGSGKNAPKVWDVTLAGIIPGSCASGADLNRTYRVCYARGTFEDISVGWNKNLASPICGFVQIGMGWSLQAAPAATLLNVTLASFSFIGQAQWRKTYPFGPSPECLTSGIVVPFYSAGTTATNCDFSASTATISPLL